MTEKTAVSSLSAFKQSDYSANADKLEMALIFGLAKS